MRSEGGRVKDFRYSTPAPRFLQTKDTYTYHKGERAILYCSVKYLGTKPVSWRRANVSYFLTIGTLPMTSDPRFEVAHIEDSPDWNMMIYNVTTTDSGMYNNNRITSSRQSNTTVITVQCVRGSTPPESIDWFKDGIKLFQTDGKEWKCVSWKRANESYVLTIGTQPMTSDPRFEVAHIEDSPDWNMMISNVTTTDSGMYECQISSRDRYLRKEVNKHSKAK
ncbi:uncharacterized protein LOC128226313 [Mya arenaria]|uniref:uncharacterized protein LOC128226313 n=1 Tax=Mya arenaria TaxID=6604 RepID=UPI0022E41BD6|nr:uncharacterized protein LOC128226313 [Mya arenaria]